MMRLSESYRIQIRIEGLDTLSREWGAFTEGSRRGWLTYGVDSVLYAVCLGRRVDGWGLMRGE